MVSNVCLHMESCCWDPQMKTFILGISTGLFLNKHVSHLPQRKLRTELISHSRKCAAKTEQRGRSGAGCLVTEEKIIVVEIQDLSALKNKYCALISKCDLSCHTSVPLQGTQLGGTHTHTHTHTHTVHSSDTHAAFSPMRPLRPHQLQV